MTEVWTRPWALLDLSRSHRQSLNKGVSVEPRGALWAYHANSQSIRLNGRADVAHDVIGFDQSDHARRLALLPLPKRSSAIRINDIGPMHWSGVPERPQKNQEPQTEAQHLAHRLLMRTELVFDRLSEVETALADPINLWRELHDRWTKDRDDVEPRMDLIVRQARDLKRILEGLSHAPRRILRRTHRMMPLARVQEMDRRAMTWLIRQPGETLAERAGNDQRILGVAREENFDTLENRVLRTYCELARAYAREFLDRHKRKNRTRRYRWVRDFAKQNQRLARELKSLGVRKAEPGATPNFVLLENPNYRQIWDAWQELLDRNRVADELWRWQPRTWEEFCAFAVMVSLQSLDGVQLVAASPISYLDTQSQGRWTENENPLGVFYLADRNLVVEVQYELARPGKARADFAAPIWLRVGSTLDALAFEKRIAVWPMWDVQGELVKGEADQLSDMLQQTRTENLAGAVIIRPTGHESSMAINAASNCVAMTLGVQGEPLRAGLSELTRQIYALITVEA